MYPTPTDPNDPYHPLNDAAEDDALSIAKWVRANTELVGHLARLDVHWELIPWEDECGLTIDGVDVLGCPGCLGSELRAVTGPGDALERVLDGAVGGWS